MSNITDEAIVAFVPPDDPLEQQAARRFIARRTMLDTHACAGHDCRNVLHDADRVLCDHYLIVLGLEPDPKQCRAYDNLGRRKLRRNR